VRIALHLQRCRWVDRLSQTLDHVAQVGHAGLLSMRPFISERIANYSIERAAAGVRDAIRVAYSARLKAAER
jgi:hypothetical protein